MGWEHDKPLFNYFENEYLDIACVSFFSIFRQKHFSRRKYLTSFAHDALRNECRANYSCKVPVMLSSFKQNWNL